jgi:2-(1,2-epoxy-1,2-dihydrophenyl)acetyl-CoA isomerase
MTYETLAVDIADGIGTVTLNRPEKLNAYTPRMGRAAAGIRRASIAIRRCAVILTGAGELLCRRRHVDVRIADRRCGGTGAGADEGQPVEAFCR